MAKPDENPHPVLPQDMLAALLADAKLVAAYGHRAGRLKDASLPAAIAAAERSKGLNWGDQAAVDLQVCLNKAIQSIAPTRLGDLKGDWRPFDAGHDKSVGILVFVVISFVLMLFAAAYTKEYNKGMSLIAGLEQLEKDQPQIRIGSIARQLLASESQIQKLNVSSDNSISQEPYFALLDQLRDFNTRLDFYVPLARQFAYENRLQFGALLSLSDLFAEAFDGSGVVGSAVAAPLAPEIDLSTLSPSDPCSASQHSETNGTAEFGKTELGKMLLNFSTQTTNLLCSQGIRVNPYTDVVINFPKFTNEIREIINVWALWIIPAIYGALGAAVFHMRRILDPSLPNPSFNRVIHRITLGAFSGVILAWFWAPSTQLYSDFTNIGLNLFGVAFLLGFSIDVFFAFLDRLVALAVAAIKRFGTSTT